MLINLLEDSKGKITCWVDPNEVVLVSQDQEENVFILLKNGKRIDLTDVSDVNALGKRIKEKQRG